MSIVVSMVGTNEGRFDGCSVSVNVGTNEGLVDG